MRTITLVVPEGIEPGDSLCFVVDGQEVEVPLPEGSKAGDALQISVGGGDGSDNAHNEADDTSTGGKPDTKAASAASSASDGICQVPLHSTTGAELTLLTTLDDTSADNNATIHSEPWPTGLVMAEIITHPTISKHILACVGEAKDRIRALELGSGLGTVGLALGTILGTEESPSEIILTDYQFAVPFLEVNISANQDITEGNVDIKADSLEWGQHTAKMGVFDIICGSDLLYGAEESYRPLVDTIDALLAKGSDDGGIVLLGVRWRKPDKEKKFFELAENSGLEFVLLGDLFGPADKESEILNDMPTLSWRKYGDVDEQEFMQHLSNTTVSTRGGSKTVSLMDLSEMDMENMHDDEHASFERTQIQIYVGKRSGTNGSKREGRDEEVDGSGSKKAKK